MHQCSKKLATSKEHCCFDHSDFPAHSVFTSDVSSGTQVQPQVILDPDYLPDYLSVSYDYGIAKWKITTINWKTFSFKVLKQLDLTRKKCEKGL